jgi:Predicted nucleotide-binding protein containing TIR-like domain
VKPRLFIGSSSENLDLAHSAQAELARDAEVTVWSQTDFELSQPTLQTLIASVRGSDFGLFIFSPDDVTKMRSQQFHTVRDNVIFELGLFIGRLGAERSFMVVPEGGENLHLPTDLLGLTAATFDPDREDRNFRAALGPACYQIRKVINRLGRLSSSGAGESVKPSMEAGPNDEGDIKVVLQSWMGSRPVELNVKAIRFADVDRELNLPAGSAEMHLEEIAKRWRYKVAHRGKSSILFEKELSEADYF